jgi:hypothetical protein
MSLSRANELFYVKVVMEINGTSIPHGLIIW